MPKDAAAVISGFKGLNNRLQPTALGWAWQIEAAQVLCDDAGFLVRRPGLRLVGSGYRDVFVSRDGRLLLVTDSHRLVSRASDGTETDLASGLTGSPFAWADMGNAIFLLSPAGKWAVYPDRVTRWGSLCPAPDLAAPVDEIAVYPPPDGERVAAIKNRLAIAAYDAETDRTAVYLSRPDFPHEFRLEKDYFMIAGRVRLFAGVQDQLVIGTDREIFAFGDMLVRLADYGASGPHAADERGLIYFMTPRGACKALPFAPMTEPHHAPDTRADVLAALLPFGGSVYAIFHQTGEMRTKPQFVPYIPNPITAVHENGIAID